MTNMLVINWIWEICNFKERDSIIQSCDQYFITPIYSVKSDKTYNIQIYNFIQKYHFSNT